MFAGKSTALYNDLFGVPAHNRLIFKPKCDTRSNGTICLHNGGKLAAIELDPEDDCVSYHMDGDITDIFIDEVQFFRPWLLREIYNLVMDRGVNVHVYGLDLDWKGEPWPMMKELLPRADVVRKLKARCNVCERPASKTFRTSSSTKQVLIGEQDSYEARCNEHFTS